MSGNKLFKSRNPSVVFLWSLGLFILMQVHQYVGVMLSSVICGASFGAVMERDFYNPCCVFWQGLVAVIIGIPLVVIIAKYLWRRSWEWIRFKYNGMLFGYGILLGLILPGLVLGLLFSLGMAAVVATPARYGFMDLLSIILGTAGFTMVVALSEELVFRGMAVREWAVRMNWPLATIFGGLYFGLVHLIGVLPHITALEAMWIVMSALIAGVLFTAMYIRSKSLWLPIGFHFGWNICLQLLFGTTMSGQEANFGLYRTELSGPAFLTGGFFGLESSVITYVIYIVAAVLFLKYSKVGKPELLSPRPQPKAD
jgi:membrane protease YdiL (CAAX protease family)